MKHLVASLLLLLLLTCAATRPSQAQTACDLAIVHATVIHTHEKRLLEDAVVLVADGRITRVAPAADIEIPQNCRIVDATGKYLLPGLVDGHIHFFQSGGLYTRPDAIDLRKHMPYAQELDSIRANIDDVFRRYLRCGITTVADAGGPMWNFDVRDAARRTAEAPRVFLTGPLIASYQPDALTTDDPPIIKVFSPEEARTLVRKQAAENPAFIKVWYVVSKRLSLGLEEFRPTMEAIVDESRKAGLPVWVHATELETARAAVQAGADVLVHDVTDVEVDEAFLTLARERGVIVVPTLWVFQSYALVLAGQFTPTREELAMADPRILGTLFDIRGMRSGDLPARAQALRDREGLELPSPVAMTNVRKLHQAGVRLAAGTDAGNIGVLHGPSLYRELALMRQAGMSAHDVLIAATLNGAALVGMEEQCGSIEEGKCADLLLLNSNPLEDVRNCADIYRVVRDGRVYDPAQLLPPSPEDLAQMQLNAYNARDLEAFLSVYDEDVEIYSFPSTLQYSGRQRMREIYGEFFEQATQLHCRLLNRITYENMVMDREYVTGVPRQEAVEAVAIYETGDGFIRKVWFVQ
ncbi:MAG: amidohydrolase family protein [Bacteroidota bacterium]|nr:amidohydrolase family protein [Bacteroidota bacterium]